MDFCSWMHCGLCLIIKSLHIQGNHLFAFSILLKMVTLDTFHIAIVFLVAINYSVLVSHRQCHCILGWALWNKIVWNSNLMIPGFHHSMKIKLAPLNLFVASWHCKVSALLAVSAWLRQSFFSVKNWLNQFFCQEYKETLIKCFFWLD